MKVLFVVLLLVKFIESTIYPSIPSELIECYRSDGPKVEAPRRLDVFLSVLKKLERSSVLDLRMFSAALLRSLRLDGIEQASVPVETEFVTPYRASSFQFNKYKLLMDLFLPSQNLLEIDVALTAPEKCFVHKVISSTIQSWERGDELAVCPMTEQTTSMSSPINSVNGTRVTSRCPIEDGVIETEWGTIAPGTVIASIAASLEAQRVLITDILNANLFRPMTSEPLMDNTEWEVNIETLDSVKSEPSIIDADISNVMVASLAGDLAEVVVNQGPRLATALQDIIIGSNNKWNDTFLPRVYYMYVRNITFMGGHITDAEILAGIDGLILSKHIPTWVNNRNSLRLSQIIDMYYSNDGVTFNNTIKACNRQSLFSKIFDRNELYNEVSRFSHVLALQQGTVYVDVDMRNKISEAAVKAFVEYAPTVMRLNHRDCTKPASLSAADIILVTDGAWKGYEVQQFASWLGNAVELGVSPGTLGLIHGSTGEWIAPPSDNLVEFYKHVGNFTNEWPTRLNLPNVLTNLIQHTQNKSTNEASLNASATLSTVVLVASTNDRLSTIDLQRSRQVMQSLRITYFDVYFAYLAQSLDGFKNINNDLDYSELFMQVDSTSIKSAVKVLKEDLININLPKSIIGPHCPFNGTTYTQTEYEDYVLIGRENKYRIHPYYLQQQATVSVEFRNMGQGQLFVCSWRGGDGARNCQTVLERQKHIFETKSPCASVDFCIPIHFSVTALSTTESCAHNDCRFPNQLNYYISHSGLRCLAMRNGTCYMPANLLVIPILLILLNLLLLL